MVSQLVAKYYLEGRTLEKNWPERIVKSKRKFNIRKIAEYEEENQRNNYKEDIYKG